ncbi:hypothetical protein TGGT1_310515 [Toxoplasma gondii GT1]|uniref:Uncharacterized protein n=2 Tax=Toxoplasma gondii TaxID=5811 RepID=S7W1D7_TOXGG|nr:hypothetical protein TGGT1_310515 [Toxoplasma gondii GT1]KFH02346.1 hypothetical protein TGVAND_310515 [Toxoplasma gondii VAND]
MPTRAWCTDSAIPLFCPADRVDFLVSLRTVADRNVASATFSAAIRVRIRKLTPEEAEKVKPTGVYATDCWTGDIWSHQGLQSIRDRLEAARLANRPQKGRKETTSRGKRQLRTHIMFAERRDNRLRRRTRLDGKQTHCPGMIKLCASATPFKPYPRWIKFRSKSEIRKHFRC